MRLKSISLLAGGAKDPIAEAEIGEEGKFSFENVPAGVVRLQPNFVSVDTSTETAVEVGRTFSLGHPLRCTRPCGRGRRPRSPSLAAAGR